MEKDFLNDQRTMNKMAIGPVDATEVKEHEDIIGPNPRKKQHAADLPALLR